MSDAVIVEVDGDIATVQLNRPKKFNAINGPLAEGLGDALDDLSRDESIRVVVLTGRGPAFCAGGDLASIWEQADGDPGPVFYELAGHFHEAVLQMRNMPKAIVGALNGPAVGGGFSVALACDLRILSDEAYMKCGYTGSGLTMDGGGSFSLPRIIGQGRAMEMVALDEKVFADQALDWGLVNRVVEAGSVGEEARQMAEQLAEMPRAAIGRDKKLFNRSFEHSLERHLEAERRQIAAVSQTPEGQEGIEAFLSKREAEYRELREHAE